jgi:hypothetical protein
MKKPLVAAALIVVILAAIALWLLWYAPPLRPSSDYSVAYSVSGQPHLDARLYRPVGIPSRYYIYVPAPSAPRYHWFLVDFSTRVAFHPSFGGTCPWGSPCVNRDQQLGLPLTDAKTEDTWQVSFNVNGVQFSNATLAVSLTKKR